MKVIQNDDGSIKLVFDDSEKGLLEFIHDSMCMSAAEIIGRSLDETFRLVELTHAATKRLSKANRMKTFIDADEY